MVAYGLGILPMICQLKKEFPDVNQPWYADDAGAGGKFDAIRRHFTRLQEIGPNYGYFPEPSKSIIVVASHNLEKAKHEFKDLGFKVVTGTRYLGGFIGENEAFNEWIETKTENWEHAVTQLAAAAKDFPQSAYAGLQKSLQQEWQFVQRATENCGERFNNLSKTIYDTFLPALFDDDIVEEDPRRKLAALPVKQAGLALPNPVQTASSNFQASSLVCSHLIAALKGAVIFSSDDHTKVAKEVKGELRERKDEKETQELSGIVTKLSCDNRRTILRGKSTGQWLSVLPSTVNGTELSAQEFRDSLHLRYARSPADLQEHCDGCSSKFTVRHAFECKNGGLIIGRHDEIRDELHYLATLAFKPSMVRDKPKINTSSPVEGAKEQTEGEDKNVRINFQKNNNDDRGDVLIRGFWAKGTDCIINV
jgi:hypothetical protein